MALRGGAVVGRTRRVGAFVALTPLVLVASGCAGGETAITGVDDSIASLTITVENEIGVPVAQESVTLDVGGSAELSTTATNALGLPVSNVAATWSSSAPAIVEVGSDGVATGLAPGSADVLATVDDVTATIRVVVNGTADPPLSP